MKKYSPIRLIKRIAAVRLDSAMANLDAVTARKERADQTIDRIAGAAARSLDSAELADLAIFGQARMRWMERANDLAEKKREASARAAKAKVMNDKAYAAAAAEARAKKLTRERRDELGAQEYLSWRK